MLLHRDHAPVENHRGSERAQFGAEFFNKMTHCANPSYLVKPRPGQHGNPTTKPTDPVVKVDDLFAPPGENGAPRGPVEPATMTCRNVIEIGPRALGH